MAAEIKHPGREAVAFQQLRKWTSSHDPMEGGGGSRVLTQKPRETHKTSFSSSLLLLRVRVSLRTMKKTAFISYKLKAPFIFFVLKEISAPPPMPSSYISSVYPTKENSGKLNSVLSSQVFHTPLKKAYRFWKSECQFKDATRTFKWKNEPTIRKKDSEGDSSLKRGRRFFFNIPLSRVEVLSTRGNAPTRPFWPAGMMVGGCRDPLCAEILISMETQQSQGRNNEQCISCCPFIPPLSLSHRGRQDLSVFKETQIKQAK